MIKSAKSIGNINKIPPDLKLNSLEFDGRDLLLEDDDDCQHTSILFHNRPQLKLIKTGGLKR